ncbi:MAG: DUF4430 domain-containing protein [Clostridia bacterium]|nr:DUF4430 domain-containing protein [Clostridia bacterium]
MKKFGFYARLSLILVLVLLVAAVAIGCSENDTAITTDAVVTAAPAERETLGEGQYTFDFTAVTLYGEKFEYTVCTDKETVCEALLDLGLVDGEDGPYGLYIKSVCGVVADYDKNQTYWAFYTNGEMSMVGADSVKCAEVKSVEFRVAK